MLGERKEGPLYPRFWGKVALAGDDDCWLWLADKARGKNPPHGRFRVGRHNCYAHRYAYEALVGSVPDGWELHHRCQNPSCVNPRHLEPMPKSDHVSLTNRGRRKTHCKRGHPFTEENTYRQNGGRSCKTCRLMNNREWWARQQRVYLGGCDVLYMRGKVG